MKDIISFVQQKRALLNATNFIQFLQDKNIDPFERLSFAPCAAPFIMSFGQLNKNAFREEPTNDVLQEIINKHTYEDDHHWVWFLEDLAKLNFNKNTQFSELLKFIWGEHTVASHKLVHELYRYTYQASPVQKLVVIEITELTANVVLAATSQIVQEIQGNTNQEFRYFGSSHLLIDSNHSYASSQFKETIENIQIDENSHNELMGVAEHIFSLFKDFMDELLNYAHKSNLNGSRSKFSESNFKDLEFDYLIIGAGPAGLQLGYYLEKIGRTYCILEAGDSPGTFFKKYPRHKKLISINKRYTGFEDPEINLRWDWNSLLSDSPEMRFTNYSKDYFPATEDLVKYLGDFTAHCNLKILYDCHVEQISKNENFCVVTSNKKIFKSKRVIIATGLSKAYVPDIPGIELADNYTDVSVTPEDFVNQKVLIIGKGNSGFETADNLLSTASLIHIVSPNPISLAWETKFVGHLRAVNNNFIDTYQLKSQNLILDAFVKKIAIKDKKYIVTLSYTHANGESEDLIYDRVIVCTGFRFDASIFDDSCEPELTINNRFPKQTSEWESSNVKDLYFAGTLTQMRDFKKKQSGFIHGFRYNVRALHHILERKYHNQELPFCWIKKTPEAMTEAILKHANVSSALWQQTGFLCGLLVVSSDSDDARYYRDIPTDYIHDSDLACNEHYYTITLEFGSAELFKGQNPLSIERVHKDDVENAAQSYAIHPIIRRFCFDKLIAEHHVIEDIASEWIEEVHVIPLQKFLLAQIVESKKRLGAYLLEAGLINSAQLEIALNEQKSTSIRLGEILSGHGWVSQQTIEYIMDKVVHQQFAHGDQQLGTYLVEAGLVDSDQVDAALNEQKTTALCLGQILSRHGWVNQRTVEYMMENIVLPERKAAIAS